MLHIYTSSSCVLLLKNHHRLTIITTSVLKSSNALDLLKPMEFIITTSRMKLAFCIHVFLMISSSIFHLSVSGRLLQESTTTNSSTNSSSNGGEVDLISVACTKAQYPDLCKSTLESNPRSHESDIKGLAAISMDVTITHAKDTISYAKKLKGQSTDTFVTRCLGDCLDEYYDALDDLGEAKSSLQRKELDEVNSFVSGAMSDVTSCEDGFSERQGYSSPLRERNQQLQMLCSNLLVITTNLLIV